METHINIFLQSYESPYFKSIHKKVIASKLFSFTKIEDPYIPPIELLFSGDISYEPLLKCFLKLVYRITHCIDAPEKVIKALGDSE